MLKYITFYHDLKDLKAAIFINFLCICLFYCAFLHVILQHYIYYSNYSMYLTNSNSSF